MGALQHKQKDSTPTQKGLQHCLSHDATNRDNKQDGRCRGKADEQYDGADTPARQLHIGGLQLRGLFMRIIITVSLLVGNSTVSAINGYTNTGHKHGQLCIMDVCYIVPDREESIYNSRCARPIPASF